LDKSNLYDQICGTRKQKQDRHYTFDHLGPDEKADKRKLRKTQFCGERNVYRWLSVYCS